MRAASVVAVAIRQRLSRHWWLVAWATTVVVLGVVLVVVTDDPHLAHTSALASIFDSRWMIAGARLLAATALLYVVASVGVRIGRGEWVRSIGPVDTDAERLVSSQELLRERLEAAEATNADLLEQLQKSEARRREAEARLATDPDQGGGAR